MTDKPTAAKDFLGSAHVFATAVRERNGREVVARGCRQADQPSAIEAVDFSSKHGHAYDRRCGRLPGRQQGRCRPDRRETGAPEMVAAYG